MKLSVPQTRVLDAIERDDAMALNSQQQRARICHTLHNYGLIAWDRKTACARALTEKGKQALATGQHSGHHRKAEETEHDLTPGHDGREIDAH